MDNCEIGNCGMGNCGMGNCGMGNCGMGIPARSKYKAGKDARSTRTKLLNPMQTLRYWFITFVLISQHNPYELIENVMLAIAMIMIIASMIFPAQKSYLALGLSLAIGSAMSILVRQAIIPSRRTRVLKIGATLILIISLYSFIDVIHNT